MTAHRSKRIPSISNKDRRKSLQDLEGHDWGEPQYPSYLVRTCHALHRKPLQDFTMEDLRIMIGQNISLDYLVPLALEQLQQDPFASGDFYPGDLLQSVLKIQPEFWQKRPDIRRAVEHIIAQIPELPKYIHKYLLIFQQQ